MQSVRERDCEHGSTTRVYGVNKRENKRHTCTRGERQEETVTRLITRYYNKHLQRRGDGKCAGEDHRRNDLGSIEHRQCKVFAAAAAARAVVVAARSAGRAARATGQVSRVPRLEVGVEELLAGTLVDRHNLVAASIGAREEVTNGEVDLLVVEVVLEDDEVLAVGVSRSDKRMEGVLDLRGALLDGTTKLVVSNTTGCASVPMMVHITNVRFMAFAMALTWLSM